MRGHWKITRVTIQVMHPTEMRYRTVGDWFFDKDGSLIIQVADTGDWRYNHLVAIHEYAEVLQCIEKGITQKQVDKFDLAHQDDEDPGSHPKAPYHDQHMTAMSIEMQMSVALGIKWRPYEECLEETAMKVPIRKK